MEPSPRRLSLQKLSVANCSFDKVYVLATGWFLLCLLLLKSSVWLIWTDATCFRQGTGGDATIIKLSSDSAKQDSLAVAVLTGVWYPLWLFSKFSSLQRRDLLIWIARRAATLPAQVGILLQESIFLASVYLLWEKDSSQWHLTVLLGSSRHFDQLG